MDKIQEVDAAYRCGVQVHLGCKRRAGSSKPRFDETPGAQLWNLSGKEIPQLHFLSFVASCSCIFAGE